MKFFFVVNPTSGKRRGPQLVSLIGRFCTQHQLAHEIWLWEDPTQDIHVRIRQAAEQGATHIVAVGGDGTVSHLAPALLNTDLTLCIIPNGTGNALSRVHGISLNPQQALQVLLDHDVYQMDVGTLDGRPFVSFAGFGIDADVAHSFKGVKERSIWRYFVLTVKHFFELHNEKVRIATPEGEHLWHVGLCSFLNISQFGGGYTIAPGASSQDAILDICGMRIFPLWDAPRVYAYVAAGKIDKLPYYSRVQARTATVTRGAAGKAQIDGDPVLVDQQMTLGVLPKALKLAVPKGSKPL
jgi:diacylglycerol kinase family enzyme